MITGDTEVKETEPIEEVKGKMSPNLDRGLMRSVMENDKETIDHGKLISDAINQGLSSFTPSAMFENLVKNYSLAKNLYGETLLRRISGYEPSSIEKNIRVPEFQRELLSRLEQNFDKLKEDDLVDREGHVTDKAIDLASLILYTDELEKIIPKGITGEKLHKREHPYGTKDDIKSYRKEKYRDIAIRRSIRTAIRRGHDQLSVEDLMSFKRKGKGERYVIYGIDASGSMKGEKLEKCKKAGIALAYKAISENDSAGLITFGTDIKAAIPPTKEFTELLREITKTRASAQTDIAGTIRESIKLFPNKKTTKHLILITDAIPTKGEKPQQEAFEAATIAFAEGITISLVGINLDKNGTEIAEKIVEAGKGRLYIVKDLKEIDKMVLMDYYET